MKSFIKCRDIAQVILWIHSYWDRLCCCRAAVKADRQSQTLTIAGSTSVQPFAEKLAEVYMQHHPGLLINVQGGGSSAGIMAVQQRAADIGASSRELNESEKNLHETVIAWDGIAVIVNPACKLDDLSLDGFASKSLTAK